MIAVSLDCLSLDEDADSILRKLSNWEWHRKKELQGGRDRAGQPMRCRVMKDTHEILGSLSYQTKNPFMHPHEAARGVRVP